MADYSQITDDSLLYYLPGVPGTALMRLWPEYLSGSKTTYSSARFTIYQPLYRSEYSWESTPFDVQRHIPKIQQQYLYKNLKEKSYEQEIRNDPES